MTEEHIDLARGPSPCVPGAHGERAHTPVPDLHFPWRYDLRPGCIISGEFTGTQHRPICEIYDARGAWIIRCADETEEQAVALAQVVVAIPAMVAALREAREYVVRDRDLLLESLCVWRNGQPDRSTLSAEDVPMVDAAEAALARIDAALAKASRP